MSKIKCRFQPGLGRKSRLAADALLQIDRPRARIAFLPETARIGPAREVLEDLYERDFLITGVHTTGAILLGQLFTASFSMFCSHPERDPERGPEAIRVWLSDPLAKDAAATFLSVASERAKAYVPPPPPPEADPGNLW